MAADNKKIAANKKSQFSVEFERRHIGWHSTLRKYNNSIVRHRTKPSQKTMLNEDSIKEIRSWQPHNRALKLRPSGVCPNKKKK